MRSSQYAGLVIRTKARRPTVAVVVFDGMSPFETGIVVEVFGLPRPELDVEWYDLLVCSIRPGPIRTVGGLSLEAPFGVESLAEADTVIVPGVSDVHREVDAELVAALRSAYDRGARIVSICSGAFALAAAGILDGRRAATHWQYASLLSRDYPLVSVEPDVLYVDEGQVLTSAGSAAGLDLCVHLVRLDHGAAVANSVARRLVIHPHRDGGQAQFVELPVPADLDDARIARSMAWGIENLREPLSLEQLARAAHMSPRSYSRHFTQKTGLSPIRWLIGQRVMASLPLLERGDARIDEIAGQVGFDSAITYRQHFRRALQTTPTAYRRAFAEKQQDSSDADRVPDRLGLQERRQAVNTRVR
jgi:AraC family transcriptional activator FtrA